MPARARKCLKCGRYYDWRGFTGQSATTLSLLIALITVSTFALEAWSSRHPTAGLVAFARTEQSEEILDFANTGDVMVAIKSIRIALRQTDQNPEIQASGEIKDGDIRWANDAFSGVVLRTIGILNPGTSQAIRVEYVPGMDEANFATLYLEPKLLETVASNLYAQSDGYPAFEKMVACEYVVTYKFVSEYVSQDDRVLTLPASCRGVAIIGRQHLRAFCERGDSNCNDP